MAKGGIKILGGVLTTTLTNWKVKKADLGRDMIYYTGGAGPSQSVIDNNDMYLMNWLDAHRVDYKYIPHPEFPDPEEQFYVIQIGKAYISYDRWGFCADNVNMLGAFDQCDFDRIKTAVRLLLAKQGKHIRRD